MKRIRCKLSLTKEEMHVQTASLVQFQFYRKEEFYRFECLIATLNILQKSNYTRGQVSVNRRISVLSNYFDVSFEIYYLRLEYIDSIGQVVKLLILRPASICCTFNSGHVGSRAQNVNKIGCPFYFHTSRVRFKRKYLLRSRKKEIIILHSTNAHVRCTIQQNGSQSESTIEISGCVTVFEDFDNFVDMNGSIYR